MNSGKKPKLLFRLLLFVLPLLVLSVIMTSTILSWTSYNYFLKTIKQNYTNIIQSSAGEIGLFMENAQRNLEGLALSVAATKIDTWQKEMALTAFNQAAVQFISVLLISPDGKVVASSGQEDRNLGQVDQSEMFHKAVSGESIVSDIMFTNDALPYIQIAIPVLHLGNVQEVLWAELDLKSVWDVLDGISIGDTGRVSIMDLSGRLIGHREMDRVVKALPPERPDALGKLQESDGTVEWIEQDNKQRVYCLGYVIPGIDWIIVLSQTYSEIYEYLYYNVFWAALVTCLVCVTAILVGWNRVKRFLTPIHILHRQVQRIGEGDLDQKVSAESGDEIGDLARAFNDMTESLKDFVRREVETAKELVHAKNLAILGTTSSKVTHEVGNLLNNVGLILPILRGEKLSPKGEMALQMLEKDSARISEFIQKFLQFAKKPELNLRRESMDAILQEVLFIYERDAQERGITIELDWYSDLPLVSVDSRLMYQVINNLLKNSLEAMAGPGSIKVEGMVDEKRLLITIRDTGSGMDELTRASIFDPFFTTKGKKGTGLGLSIVKTIVEAHRGAIECRSEPHKGTAFALSLPLH